MGEREGRVQYYVWYVYVLGGGSSNSCPVSMNVSKENDDMKVCGYKCGCACVIHYIVM